MPKKPPIDLGNKMFGRMNESSAKKKSMKENAAARKRNEETRLRNRATSSPKKPKPAAKTTDATGIIGKTGGRIVGGYSSTSGKAPPKNRRIAQTEWSKKGGARQNRKKELPKSL